MLANDPGLGDSQVHVHERRCSEGVAAGLQVAAAKIAVAVLVDRHAGCRGVAEAALGTENATNLNLPRQFHQAMHLERMAEGKIRWAILKPCTVVKLIGWGDEVPIACNERPTGVRLTRTRHSTGIRVRYSRIRDYRHNSPEAISGISVVPAERIGAQIGVERVIVFRNKGI